MRRVAALIAFTLLVGLTACGTGDSLTLNGQPIDDPGGFLQRAERTWRHYLAGKRVTISKDARCYFVASGVDHDVDSALFCGPVRHLVGRPDTSSSADEYDNLVPGQGAWDKLEFFAGHMSSELALGKISLASLGVPIPDTAKLIRPDGEKPPSKTTALTAPAPPRAKPGLLVITDNVAIENASRPHNSEIITPRIDLQIVSVGTAKSVQTEQGTRAPARGERLMAAQIHLSDGPLRAAYRPDSIYRPDQLLDAEPSFALDVDGDRKELSFDDTASSQALVASVPKSSDPELVVTAAGTEQRLSLTTGRRVSTNATAFYQKHNELKLSQAYSTSKATDGDFDISHSMRFTDAELTAFHPTLGWADKGKSWLIVNTDQREFQWDDLYSIKVDHPATASVTDSAGSVSTDATPSQTQDFFIPSELIQLAFQVDSTQREFQLTYRPTVEFRSQGPGPDPGRGTVRLKPLTFPLDFPAR